MLWTLAVIILLMLVSTLVFSFPSVQTWTAKQAVAWVNEKYDTEISLEKFRYIFPDEFVLKEVYVADSKGDTMVYASAVDLHFDGFLNNTAASQGAEIQNLQFNYLKYEGEEDYDFKKFTEKFSTGKPPSGNPFGLEIAAILIQNGQFRYEDFGCDSCTEFYIENLNAEIDDFDLEGQYFTMDVQSLSGDDRYSLNLKTLQTVFSYQEKFIDFENIELITERSKLKGDFRMEYDSIKAMQDFVNQVKIIANIESGEMASEDIRHFGPEMPDFQVFYIEGKAEGIVNNLEMKDLKVEVGENTTYASDLSLRNTIDVDNIFIKAQNIDLFTTQKDIEFLYGLFSDSALPTEIKPLGNLVLAGNFEGYLSDFQTQLKVQTDLGQMSVDALFHDPQSAGQITYQGKLAVQEFDFGVLLGDSSLGRVSADIDLDGRGTDPVKMNTVLKGNISLLEYNDYDYRGISVDGKIAQSRFQGDFGIDDPNLKFDFNGTANFGQDTSRYDFNAQITKADLFALHFVPDSVAEVTGDIEIDLKALNYDHWAGDVRFHSFTYSTRDNFYFFDTITAHSEGLDSNRYFEIRSDIVEANLRGDYSLAGMAQVAKSQMGKFIKGGEKTAPPEDQDFNFDITVKNAQILIDILVPKLEIEPNSVLTGTYSSDTNTFNIDIESPGMAYDGTAIRGIDLHYLGGTEKSVLEFEVASLELASGFAIDSIELNNDFYRDTLLYDLSMIFRDSVNSRARIDGYALQTDTNDFQIGINESRFNVGFEDFVIKGGNRILLDTGGIHIEDLQVANSGRSIFINGNISDNPNEILRLHMEGFGIDLLNYFIGSPSARFNGELYGDVIITQLLGAPKFAADLSVDSMEMNSTLLGNFNVTSDWAVEDDTIKLNTKMTLGELTTFSGEGWYQPDSTGGIFMDLDFDQFRLAAFNPFLTGLAENLRGYANGEVQIRGNTGAPVVTGDLTLPKTAFKVSFLQTDYNLVGTPRVQILEDRITFPDLRVRDTEFGTEGTVRGKITHQNFKNFNLDLRVDADELLVLNTTAQSNDPYYGTAFVSGFVTIRGAIDELKIAAEMTSERDTRFFIPIDGATEVRETDFVTFVNPTQTDTLKKESNSDRFNLDKGIAIDFELNINQNADVGIIIDSDVGNQLEATGNGTIRLKIAPYGAMEIYGTYTVAEGNYDFVMGLGGAANIKREFDVLRGGTVTWNGDPYNALINLTARYTTRADPSPLVVAYNGGNTLVQVDLYLSGELMNPDIDFDISAPRANGQVQSVLGNQLGNRNEKFQQVFSLLALNAFAPQAGGPIFASGGGNNWDFLANQAASFLNNFTGDVDISLGYQGGGTNVNDPTAINAAQQQVEVGGSYRFLDDRVTVNGSVGVPVGQDRSQSKISGDVEVEYSITQDGKLRAKVFNRSVQQYSFGQQNYQQGLGVFYRLEWSTWADLWRILSEEEEAPSDEPQNQPGAEDNTREGAKNDNAAGK